MKISFHGADRGVTGSCHLVECGGRRILIDCGLYQERAYLDRNWQRGPIPVEELEAELNFDQLAIGFNVTYLLDALKAVDAETIRIELKDANSSCLISAESGGNDRHVVMPLKL